MLATFPGISPLCRRGYLESWIKDWHDTWRITSRSALKIFAEVLAAMSFLYGLAAEELRSEELDNCDSNYEVIITLMEVKP